MGYRAKNRTQQTFFLRSELGHEKENASAIRGRTFKNCCSCFWLRYVHMAYISIAPLGVSGSNLWNEYGFGNVLGAVR